MKRVAAVFVLLLAVPPGMIALVAFGIAYVAALISVALADESTRIESERKEDA